MRGLEDRAERLRDLSELFNRAATESSMAWVPGAVLCCVVVGRLPRSERRISAIDRDPAVQCDRTPAPIQRRSVGRRREGLGSGCEVYREA